MVGAPVRDREINPPDARRPVVLPRDPFPLLREKAPLLGLERPQRVLLAAEQMPEHIERSSDEQEHGQDHPWLQGTDLRTGQNKQGEGTYGRRRAKAPPVGTPPLRRHAPEGLADEQDRPSNGSQQQVADRGRAQPRRRPPGLRLAVAVQGSSGQSCFG